MSLYNTTTRALQQATADQVAAEESTVRTLPTLMRNGGYPVGAQMIDHWLAGTASARPETRHNTRTIRMSWVTSPRFRRAADAHAEMTSPAAVAKYLEAAEPNIGPGQQFTMSTGSDGDDARRLHERLAVAPLLHSRTVGTFTDYLGGTDDLYVALGRFQLVAFLRRAAGTQTHLSASEVGVYVRDSFDFNDEAPRWNAPGSWISQPLGMWGNAGGPFQLGGVSLSNSSFQRYRARHRRGADFLVYSDIRVTRYDPPVQIVRKNAVSTSSAISAPDITSAPI